MTYLNKIHKMKKKGGETTVNKQIFVSIPMFLLALLERSRKNNLLCQSSENEKTIQYNFKCLNNFNTKGFK